MDDTTGATDGGPAAEHTIPAEAEPVQAEAVMTAAPAAPRRFRKRSIAMLAAATILVSGGTGAGIAAVAVASYRSGSATASEGTTLTPNSGTGTQSQGGTSELPFSFGNGYGYGSGYGSDQSGSGSDSTSGSAADSTSTSTASDSESTGVVLIDTKLGYLDGEAAGTGIILTSDGEILTNNHVVEGSTSITVTVATTGKSYTAEVVGTDPTDDIAVLQLKDASGLATAELDTSDAVAVGDDVTGVGNAQGQGYLSAADGSVTATDQQISVADDITGASKTLTGLIETDAPIVSGDSGGPLLDSDGEVVGIDTAASSNTQDPTGYAIPIAHAISIVKKIESGTESGSITLGLPAFLGVTLADTQSGGGATIAGSLTETPAAKAGLVAGDTITKVDGKVIASSDELSTVIATYEPGDKVAVTWADSSGQTHTATLTLIAGPAK